MFERIKRTRYLQYLAVLTATLSMTSQGTYNAWPSPSLPILSSPSKTPLDSPITVEEGSWIVSGQLLTSIPFNFVLAWLLERYGRRWNLLAFGFTLAIPWIMILLAKDPITIIVARTIAGFGMSVTFVALPIYSAEIADSDIRGRLATIIVAMKQLGTIVVYSAGPFVSYSALAWICFSLPLLFLATFYFMPESPHYLVKSGKSEEARRVVRRLASKKRGEELVDEKMEIMERTLARDGKNKSSLMELFTNADYRKPLLIMLGLKTLQQLNGQTAISPYMQTIMELTKTNISPGVASIFFGIVPLPAVLLVGVIVDKIGRKPLLIVSALGSAVALIAEGAYFYMQDVLKSDLENWAWLPAIALIFYKFSLSLGVTTIPYIYLGEVFASNIKSHGVAVTIFYTKLLIFFVSKYFYPLSLVVGMYSTFWFFAAVCVAGAIFVHYAVPETKKKSFEEIQSKLNPNRRQDGGNEP